jgi:hypothetical protein
MADDQWKRTGGKVEALRCETQGGAPPLAILAITAEG